MQESLKEYFPNTDKILNMYRKYGMIKDESQVVFGKVGKTNNSDAAIRDCAI